MVMTVSLITYCSFLAFPSPRYNYFTRFMQIVLFCYMKFLSHLAIWDITAHLLIYYRYIIRHDLLSLAYDYVHMYTHMLQYPCYMSYVSWKYMPLSVFHQSLVASTFIRPHQISTASYIPRFAYRGGKNKQRNMARSSWCMSSCFLWCHELWNHILLDLLILKYRCHPQCTCNF